jgi:kynurenine formamidase
VISLRTHADEHVLRFTRCDRRLRLIDLSHVIRDGLPTMPGLPAATRISLPFQRHVEGEGPTALGIERLAALPGTALDPTALFDPTRLRLLDFGVPRGLGGRALLLRTGWDARFGQASYWTDGPRLSAATVDALLAVKAALVGVDFAHSDDASEPEHARLLAAGIPLVENLTGLGTLPASGFRFFSVPLELAPTGASACHAFAIVNP